MLYRNFIDGRNNYARIIFLITLFTFYSAKVEAFTFWSSVKEENTPSYQKNSPLRCVLQTLSIPPLETNIEILLTNLSLEKLLLPSENISLTLLSIEKAPLNFTTDAITSYMGALTPQSLSPFAILQISSLSQQGGASSPFRAKKVKPIKSSTTLQIKEHPPVAVDLPKTYLKNTPFLSFREMSLKVKNYRFDDDFIKPSLLAYLPGSIFQPKASCRELLIKKEKATHPKLSYQKERLLKHKPPLQTVHFSFAHQKPTFLQIENLYFPQVKLIRNTKYVKKQHHSSFDPILMQKELFAGTKKPLRPFFLPTLSKKPDRCTPKKSSVIIELKPNLLLPTFTLMAHPQTSLSLAIPKKEYNYFFQALHANCNQLYNKEYKETIFPDARVIESASMIEWATPLDLQGRYVYESWKSCFAFFPFEEINYTRASSLLLENFVVKLPSLPLTSPYYLGDRDFSFSLLNGKGAMISLFAVLEDALRANRLYRFTQNDLLHIPTLELLYTESVSDEFEKTIRMTTQMDKTGFIYSLQLSPQNPLHHEPLRHRVIYLLDKSQALEKHHFETYKKAIAQSLQYVDPDASVNILTIDNELHFLHENDLRPTSSSIQFLQRALSKLQRGKQTYISTLVEALRLLKDKARETQDIYTVIFISNGQLMKNIRLNREALSEIIKDMPSNLALYSAAAGEQNNLEMLDLMARLGKGQLMYATTCASFPRKLSILMKKLRHPLATNITITNLKENHSSPLENMGAFAPILYAQKPYQIVSSVKNLDSIELFIQGYEQRGWINIRKEFSLREAIQGNQQLEKEFAKMQALEKQVQYIMTNDPAALLEAQKILSHFDQKSLYLQ